MPQIEIKPNEELTIEFIESLDIQNEFMFPYEGHIYMHLEIPSKIMLSGDREDKLFQTGRVPLGLIENRGLGKEDIKENLAKIIHHKEDDHVDLILPNQKIIPSHARYYHDRSQQNIYGKSEPLAFDYRYMDQGNPVTGFALEQFGEEGFLITACKPLPEGQKEGFLPEATLEEFSEGFRKLHPAECQRRLQKEFADLKKAVPGISTPLNSSPA